MSLKRTSLYEACLEEGGKMVAFAGWEMPIQFSGLINEHQAVRSKAGLFDISHMGVIKLEGKNTKNALQQLIPTDIYRINNGEACYSLLLNENGGIIDDLLIYDIGLNSDNQEILFLVINAASTEKDIQWLKQHLIPQGIHISDEKNNGCLLALQGPEAGKLLSRYCQEAIEQMPRFSHKTINLKNLKPASTNSMFIARTGYTGEDGFEILLTSADAKILWKELISKGVTPCGLGSRDTLRLEAGMHLYGSDISSSTTPFEAGLGWTVHLEMPSTFIGRTALEKQASSGIKRKLIGIEMKDRSIPRKGYSVFIEEEKVGTITSGTWSPSLQKGIAMAYVPKEFAELGRALSIEVRGKKYLGNIVKRSFYQRNS